MKIVMIINADDPENTYCYTGVGECLGAAAFNLLENIKSLAGLWSFSDGILFGALHELFNSDTGTYKYIDMSCPEDDFILEIKEN